jgi:hypothetical protein
MADWFFPKRSLLPELSEGEERAMGIPRPALDV